MSFTASGTSPAGNSVASEYAFRRGLGSSIEHREMRKRTIGADTPLGGEPSDILSAYEERNLLYEGVSIVHRMFGSQENMPHPADLQAVSFGDKMIAQVPKIWRKLPTVRYHYVAAQLWFRAPMRLSDARVDGCREPMDLLYNIPLQDVLPEYKGNLLRGVGLRATGQILKETFLICVVVDTPRRHANNETQPQSVWSRLLGHNVRGDQRRHAMGQKASSKQMDHSVLPCSRSVPQ